jgi:hypothetical protein
MQHRRSRLRFTQAVLDHLPEVMRLLTEASSSDEALVNIAALLGVDEVDVPLSGQPVSTCSPLTRPATERRLQVPSPSADVATHAAFRAPPICPVEGTACGDCGAH